MDEDTEDVRTTPDTGPDDPLTALLRRGARDLLKQAVEAELQTFLDDHAGARLPDGRRAVARNGHQRERTTQTGLGDVPVQMPKTRDRAGAGRRLHSGLLPLYLRRTRARSKNYCLGSISRASQPSACFRIARIWLLV